MPHPSRKKPFVFVNQSAGDLCADIVNAFVEGGKSCVLITGSTKEDGLERLNASVKIDPMIRYEKSRTWRRLWTWGWGTFQIWRKLFFKYRGADVFMVTNPPFATWVPLCVGNRFWVLVYDIYPEVLIQAGLLAENGIVARLWRAAHRRVYARAQHIFTLGKGMADCLSHYVAREKIAVIANWTDTSFLNPVAPEANLFRKKYALEGKFVVMYSGNIGNTHRVEALVEVANALKAEKDIVFVIVGEGGKKALIERTVRACGLENCLLLPYQPKEWLPHSLGAADIGVITLEEKAAQLSVPSKTFNLLAAGCALLCIAGPECELERLVTRYQAGERFGGNDIEGMVAYILRLRRDAAALERYRHNARAAAAHFTPANARLYFEWIAKSLDSKN